jgi:hypothetical protein
MYCIYKVGEMRFRDTHPPYLTASLPPCRPAFETLAGHKHGYYKQWGWECVVT